MPRLAVRLTPRAGTDAIDGVGPAGELRIRVSARAVDGRANTALVRLLADALGVPVSAVVVEQGSRSRHKLVRLDGVAAADLARLWPEVRAS